MLNTVPDALMSDLQIRYGEPQRHYHDWSHITALFSHFERTIADITEPAAVLYAVLYHDAVYDPQARGNEAASADLLIAAALPIAPPSLTYVANYRRNAAQPFRRAAEMAARPGMPDHLRRS